MRDWLKKARKKKKLSQEELAALLEWSDDKIGRIEREQQTITPQEIRKIGETLGLSEEEIGRILLKEAGLLEDLILKVKPQPREEQRVELEVHVAGVCVRKNNGEVEILVAKRLPTRELYPGKWECGGGQVRLGENFEEAIKRQMEEEFGIKVKILSILRTYEILTPQLLQRKIPGIVFLCELENYINERGIQLNRKEFSEYKWIKANEVIKMDFIEGVKKDIKIALKIYKSLYLIS
jgi:8-oxo-dGTP pyrophosphatase MutT (NUDIX family)/DNA-binding transcriptional regulator YiaG